MGRQRWLPDGPARAVSLVRDLAECDPDAYHRFLWSHHLGYAESYEPRKRFGPANLRPERRLLFEMLRRFLREIGVAQAGIGSVLEVGCSLGHLLRFVETDVFRAASVLEGLDIDEYAVRSGNRWLEDQGSRVRLMVADMADMDAVLERDQVYDVVLCAGVLMYLRQEQAARVVESMLRRARTVLVLSGLAHPERDNKELARSQARARDGTFVHNLDAMVSAAGGTVLWRRWDAGAPPGWNTPYFVFGARQSA
jgi:SAM-dependent methyltransferase